MIAVKRKLFLQNVMTDAAGTVLSLQLHVVPHLCTCCCLAEQQCQRCNALVVLGVTSALAGA